MSLVVWLPLTKDLRQQGLSNVTVTNNGATFNSAGKLGGCYEFASGKRIQTTLPSTSNLNSKAISFACWVNISSWNSSYDCLMSIADGTGWQQSRATLCRNNTASTLCWNIADGSTSTRVYTTTSVSTNTWYHVACTYDGANLKIYVNGALNNSAAATLSIGYAGTFNIGGWSGNNYPINCKMNDIRVYNHCLSPMEVKELAKGLVLHYPLNRQGWGQDNILLNTGFQSRYTQSTGWDTTKNGTQLANSWGGYNSGVPNPSTVYHAHLKQVNGEWVYEYIKTANENWLGIAQGGLQSKLTAGKTYTFSWEEYRVEGNNYPTGGLYYYKTGATSANFHLGQFGGSSGNILGQWRKFSYTFTAPTDGDYSKNMAWYIYGTSGGNGKMYMRHPKLEEGSIATPWCPNSSDTLATTMGFNSTTEYDCSGFCNNGTRTGTFSWTSDTPKYAVSTYFVDYTQKLRAPIVLTTPAAITMAVWIKSSNTSPRGSYHMPLNIDGARYEFSIGTDGRFRQGFYINNSRVVDTTSSKNVLDGQWHHLCATFDGATIKRYVDGVAVTGGDHSASGTLATTAMLYVGDYGSNETYGNTQIYESDIRIYATALSADDVKSLYQNCATIDPDGTIRGQIRS